MEKNKFDAVCAILDKYRHDPNKLIPILREIQDQYGYLPEDLMIFVSTALGVSPASVFGVATFFSHFTLEPKGKHIVKVCDGTACHVRRSQDIADALRKELGLAPGTSTTPDKLFTLETVACLGACSLAPAVVMDGTVHGSMTPDAVRALIAEIRTQEEAASNE